MVALLEVVWFVLPHLTFSLSAERTTRSDKSNCSCWKHFSGNQFDCFTWQVCKFPKLGVLSLRWKMLWAKVMVFDFLWVHNISSSPQFVRQLVHKAFNKFLCLETAAILLNIWEKLQEMVIAGYGKQDHFLGGFCFFSVSKEEFPVVFYKKSWSVHSKYLTEIGHNRTGQLQVAGATA